MATAKEILEELCDARRQMRVPDITMEFVLRNGKEFTGSIWSGKRAPQGECYKNAIDLAGKHNWGYVEGYVFLPRVGIPINHGWCEDPYTEDIAIDNTAQKPQDNLYFGVSMQYHYAASWILKHGYYGLYSDGCMVNFKFMCDFDEGFQEHIEKLAPQLKGRRLYA